MEFVIHWKYPVVQIHYQLTLTRQQLMMIQLVFLIFTDVQTLQCLTMTLQQILMMDLVFHSYMDAQTQQCLIMM